jgi:hypothetical protein
MVSEQITPGGVQLACARQDEKELSGSRLVFTDSPVLQSLIG